MFFRFLAEHWNQKVNVSEGVKKQSLILSDCSRERGRKSETDFSLTSTHVSISENWFMMGRMVSMELPLRRSDLFPTRMMGILMVHMRGGQVSQIQETKSH